MIFNEENYAETLLTDGFIKNNVGKYTTDLRILGKYHKMFGCTDSETKKLLKSYYTKYTGITDNIMIDKKVNKIVNTLFTKNINLHNKNTIPVLLEDMQIINQLDTDGERRVLFYAMMCARFYNKHIIHIGSVYCGRSMALSRVWVVEVINKLIEKGFIHVKSFDPKYGTVTRFTINDFLLDTDGKEPIYNVGVSGSSEKILLDDYFQVYNKCIQDFKFKVSRDFKKQVKKRVA